MITPINNYQQKYYIKSSLPFKNNGDVVKDEPCISEKRDSAIIDFIEKSEKREKNKTLVSYIALGYCFLALPALFILIKNKKKNTEALNLIKKNFVSLKDDPSIPTLDNCKTINKKLQRFLQQQVEYSKLTPEELKQAGNPKPVQKFILSGPPGVGKSFYAKIYAKTLDAEYAEIKYSEINKRFCGEHLENLEGIMEGIIDKANYNSKKKFVVVFNEIDALIPSAENLSGQNTGHSVFKLEERNLFLNCLDKISQKCPNVTIIGTTNVSPKNTGLDGAALSRFKKVMSVDFPEQDCLFEGLKMYLKDIPNSEQFINENKDKLQDLAKQMSDRKCSFRDLTEVIELAKTCHWEERTKNKEAKFSYDYLEKALKDIECTDGEMQAGK